MYSDLNIAVIGDIMLDHWREGTEYKLNPESPTIDITNPTSEYTLGGAGNVARIVAGLGAKVYLLGVLGEYSGEENCRVSDLCRHRGITKLLAYEQRVTTVKERIVCNGQQICRISEEDTGWIEHTTASELITLLDGLDDLDGIILADYSKGVMRDMMVHAVIHIAEVKHIPVLVDPKNRLYIYKGCTIMKPNQKEYDAAEGRGNIDPGHWGLEFEHLVITSEGGMKWNSRNGDSGEVDVYPVEVVNVSGCGDATAAVILMEYIRNGNDIEGAVKLANWAASRVVKQERTGHLSVDDLEAFINEPIPMEAGRS